MVLWLLLLMVMLMPCMRLLCRWDSTVCCYVGCLIMTRSICEHSSSSYAPAGIYPVIQLQGVFDTCSLQLLLHITPACTHRNH